MRYDLSQQEHSAISQRLQEISSHPINLDNDELRAHGQSWTKEHMDALRIAHLDNLPLDRFFPLNYIPADTDPAEVTQLKEDDIRSFSLEKCSISAVGFINFFNHLAELVTTGEAILPEWLHSDSSSEVLPTSDEKDGAEYTARSCLISLLVGIVAKPSLGEIVPGWEFIVSGRKKSCKIWLGNSGKVKALNDGCVTLKTWDSVTGENMISPIPLVSFEAKARRPGDPDPFNWDTFAQEVAKLLGQAMASCKEMHGGWKDQDAWLISIHGTKVRLVTARFKEGYLRQVNSSMVARTEYLVVFRSRPFDLILDEGRVQAVKAIVALLRWIKSGSSLQSTMHGLLNAARAGA